MKLYTCFITPRMLLCKRKVRESLVVSVQGDPLKHPRFLSWCIVGTFWVIYTYSQCHFGWDTESRRIGTVWSDILLPYFHLFCLTWVSAPTTVPGTAKAFDSCLFPEFPKYLHWWFLRQELIFLNNICDNDDGGDDENGKKSTFIECSLCSRHYSKWFVYINLFNLHNRLVWWVMLFYSGRTKLREVK